MGKIREMEAIEKKNANTPHTSHTTHTTHTTHTALSQFRVALYESSQ
jgi:hypothetical protein